MRKSVNLLLLVLILALGAGYVFLGPSLVLGGPSKAEITRVTRDAMLLSAASPEEDAAAKAARITPQGLCSKGEAGVWACMVQVSRDGAEDASFITQMKWSAGAGWAPAS